MKKPLPTKIKPYFVTLPVRIRATPIADGKTVYELTEEELQKTLDKARKRGRI